jgi:hypothetical protein
MATTVTLAPSGMSTGPGKRTTPLFASIFDANVLEILKSLHLDRATELQFQEKTLKELITCAVSHPSKRKSKRRKQASKSKSEQKPLEQLFHIL